MADLRAAAQQALEALQTELMGYDGPVPHIDSAIAALRDALAQAEPVQPVATFDDPYRDHWAAIAEAAQKIAASTECGPAEAKALCDALDRLTEAELAESVQQRDESLAQRLRAKGYETEDSGSAVENIKEAK